MSPVPAISTARYLDVLDPDISTPDISAIVTEDDAPVDNFPSEKQQRLLTESLYSSWSGPPPDDGAAARTFLTAANVGVFSTTKLPGIVPDVLLALDVELHPEWWKKENRSYFIWEIGKAPELAIEIVSNRDGNELGAKLKKYAWLRIPYYVVWDPSNQLGGAALRLFELRGIHYVPMDRPWFEAVGLGLKVWDGVYEARHDQWLRWCQADGTLVPTGAERADAERARAEAERARADVEHSRAEVQRERAESEHKRAENQRSRAERLAARLRELGIDPDQS